MAIITFENQGTNTIIRIEGVLDETFSIDEATQKVGKSVRVNCSKVSRVNSTGIKKWILYFQGLQKKQIPIVYEDVSPALVEQFNSIMNFSCGGEVESLLLPYACEKCGHTFTIRFTKAEALSSSIAPVHPCPKCQAPDAEFDDLEDEYLNFLGTKVVKRS